MFNANRPDTYNTPRGAWQVIDAIANSCSRAERNGSSWKCNCPICGRHSLSITYGHRVPILIHCWHCESNGINDGHSEHRALFVEKGLLEPDERTIKLDQEAYAKFTAKRRAKAKEIWNGRLLRPINLEDPAGEYLRLRGLASFTNHTALRTPGGAVFLARVFHVEYGISAIQWTWPEIGYDENRGDYLTGKAEKRETEGVLKGGAVWINAPQADEPVVIAEGLETLLSAMKLLNLKCGAAVLGPNLKGLVLPQNVRRVLIAADNDETGRGAAECAAKVWRERGLRVRISYPEIVGKDFNDVLMGRMG